MKLMLTKIFAVVLCLSMLLTVVTVSAEDKAESYAKEIGVLSQLGVLDVTAENAVLTKQTVINGLNAVMGNSAPQMIYFENHEPTDALNYGHYDFNSTATNERDKYLPMVNKKNETGGMTFLSQPSADDNWSHGDRACWVAKTRMRNELQKGQDGANANEKAGKIGRDYPVKVFTAPKAGIVNIGAALLAPVTEGESSNIRIMKMPADGGDLVRVMPYDKFYSFTTAVTEFPTTIVEVKKGDKLLFEAPYIYHAETAKDAWKGTLDWDPTVTYLVDDVAAATTYKSSEYFSHINADGTWANGVWAAMFYDYESTADTEWGKYTAPIATKDFTGDGRGVTYLSQLPLKELSWGDKAVTIGKTFMRADVNAATTDEEWNYITRDYPVKVFTSPKAGVVSIDAETLAPYTAGNLFAIRIMKLSAGETTPVQIFPGSGFYRDDKAVDFVPVDAYLEEGDKLLFEAPYRPTKINTDITNGFSAYSSALDWDPTVTYTDGTAVDRADIVFKNGENTVTDFADIAAAASLTAEVPVFSGTAYDNAIVFVGIYDADGMLVRIAVSDSKPVVAGEETPFSVTFTDAASSLTAGSVKVFLWDSLTGLNALTDAGSIAVMVQEAVQE